MPIHAWWDRLQMYASVSISVSGCVSHSYLAPTCTQSVVAPTSNWPLLTFCRVHASPISKSNVQTKHAATKSKFLWHQTFESHAWQHFIPIRGPWLRRDATACLYSFKHANHFSHWTRGSKPFRSVKVAILFRAKTTYRFNVFWPNNFHCQLWFGSWL